MSAIYLTNPNSTNILANGIVPCYVNKKPGCAIQYGGNSAIIGRPGYYHVMATVTFTGADTGNASLAIQKNGVTVPGLTAVETIETEDTEVHTVAIQGIIRILCHEGPATITLVNTSEFPITTSNVSISIIG